MNRRRFIQSLAATMLVASSMRLAHAVDLSFLRDTLPVYFSCKNAKGEPVILPMNLHDNGDTTHEFSADELDERSEAKFNIRDATLHIHGETFGPYDQLVYGDVQEIAVHGIGSTLTVTRPIF